MWPRMGSATFPLRERGALTVRPARLLPAGLPQLSVPSCVWARGLPPSESPGRGSGRRGPGLDSGKLPGSSPGAAGLSLSLPPLREKPLSRPTQARGSLSASRGTKAGETDRRRAPPPAPVLLCSLQGCGGNANRGLTEPGPA